MLSCTRDYTNELPWEHGNRKNNLPPPIDEYIQKRLFTSATLCTFDLIEFALNNDISEVFDDPFIQEFRRLAANLVNWDNDLLSAPKEILKNDIHNLVIVYKHHSNCSYKEAIDKAAATLKHDLEAFEKLCSNTPHFSEDVKNYLTAIKE